MLICLSPFSVLEKKNKTNVYPWCELEYIYHAAFILPQVSEAF